MPKTFEMTEEDAEALDEALDNYKDSLGGRRPSLVHGTAGTFTAGFYAALAYARGEKAGTPPAPPEGGSEIDDSEKD